MLVVTGTVELAPQDVDKMIEIGKTMTAASRTEPGCHGYAYYQDIENPCVIRAYEVWEDEAALKAHFGMPHTREFERALSGLHIVNFDVFKYDRTHVRALR